jgi:hypothetical protein
MPYSARGSSDGSAFPPLSLRHSRIVRSRRTCNESARGHGQDPDDVMSRVLDSKHVALRRG